MEVVRKNQINNALTRNYVSKLVMQFKLDVTPDYYATVIEPILTEI